MATSQQIDAAVAAATPRHAVGAQEYPHTLTGVNPANDEEERKAALAAARAARCVARHARNDLERAFLLDVLGLGYATSEPAPERPVAPAPAAVDEPPRTCAHCGHPKPADAFYRDASNSSGRSYWCKTCSNQARNARRHQAAERNTA